MEGEYRDEQMNRLMHPRQELKHCTNKLLIVFSQSQKNAILFQRVRYNPLPSESLKIFFVVTVLVEKR